MRLGAISYSRERAGLYGSSTSHCAKIKMFVLQYTGILNVCAPYTGRAIFALGGDERGRNKEKFLKGDLDFRRNIYTYSTYRGKGKINF